MGIEYLSNFKPGDKIDLSRFEKRPEKRWESYLPGLRHDLRRLADKVNASFPGFLEADGRIALGGREAESDASLVASQEEAFRGSKELDAWRRDSEKNPASLTEMALTVALDKYLGEDFIVARASAYDDYNNGVDQVLIYRPTGEVLCGFDEVIGHNGDDGGQKKAAKLERLLARGGARVKYGAKLEDGKLVRASLRNIPAFFMSLSKEELSELLASLEENKEESGPAERRIITKIINSLENQVAGQKLSPELEYKTAAMFEKLNQALAAKRQ